MRHFNFRHFSRSHFYFNSRTSCEVRQHIDMGYTAFYISTHAPLARCDENSNNLDLGIDNFNSRTSCEVRRFRSRSLRTMRQFQLTHLLRGATVPPPDTAPASRFQLTHLLRGATLAEVEDDSSWGISTHAPLARCDRGDVCDIMRSVISTHAPLARCDWRSRLPR